MTSSISNRNKTQHSKKDKCEKNAGLAASSCPPSCSLLPAFCLLPCPASPLILFVFLLPYLSPTFVRSFVFVHTVAKSRGLIHRVAARRRLRLRLRPDLATTALRSDLGERARARERKNNLRSSAEIYSGNKILFAPLVDGTINSSGIRPEHVLQLQLQPAPCLSICLSLPPCCCCSWRCFLCHLLSCLLHVYARSWVVFQGRLLS